MKLKISVISVALIIIMLASWLLNFGWIRLAFTFLLFPLIHATALFLANLSSAKVIGKNKYVRPIIFLSCVTFLLPHLLIADGGDIGQAYIFFHLIESNKIADITTPIGEILLFINFALLVMQFMLYFKYREKKSSVANPDKT